MNKTDKAICKWLENVCEACSQAIQEIKARDKQKEGTWIDSKQFGFWECSYCGWYNDFSKAMFKYCPNCGAIMKGGAKDDSKTVNEEVG